MKRQRLKIKKEELLKIFFNVIIFFFIFLTVLVAVNIINEIKRGRYIGQEIERQNTISVSATGEVFAKPDLALISFSVKTEEKTVSEAMQENTEKMNATIDFMKAQGIEEKDLKTTSFNIYPRYEYRKEETETYIYPPPTGKRVLVGYEVIQSLQVKIRDMSKIGDIIEGATRAGANEVGGLQFIIDNEDEFKKQARKQAIEKAKDKAKELASHLGVRLVRISNFQESSIIPRFYELEKAMGGGETPQIETGENLIEVTVFITYEIN